jgi:hypothetical protein
MNKVCLDDLTVGQVKELAKLAGGTSTEHPYQVGKNYFIRTVTHHYTGKLVRVTAQELVLEDAAWIADDGRFSKALEDGELNEVEPFPAGDVIIGRGAVLDASIWGTALPRKVK